MRIGLLLFFSVFYFLGYCQSTYVFTLEVRDFDSKKLIPRSKIRITYDTPAEQTVLEKGVGTFDLIDLFGNVELAEDIYIDVEADGYVPEFEYSHTLANNSKTEKIYLKKIKHILIQGNTVDKATNNFLENVTVKYLKDFIYITETDGFFRLKIPVDVMAQIGPEQKLTFQKAGYLDKDTIITVDLLNGVFRPIEVLLDADTKVNYSFPTIRFRDKYLWTIENLSDDLLGSWCYDDSSYNCENYGRLYDWETAQNACEVYGEGWRLPTQDEWKILAMSYGGIDVVGERPIGDPRRAYDEMQKALDIPLSGKKHWRGGKYQESGTAAYFWTATEDPRSEDRAAYISLINGEVQQSYTYKAIGMACRCIKTLER